MTTSAFSGFGPRCFEFFAELEANNDKAWFDANRTVYERQVRDPMRALLDELAERVGAPGRAKVFRLNRDVRFSADKTPYKEAQGAHIPIGGKGTLYVQINADGVMTGGGAPHFDAGQLARYRAAVDGDAGVLLEAIVVGLRHDGAHVGTLGNGGVVEDGDLKRVPSPYAKDHPRGDLLRLKRLIAAHDIVRPMWITTPEAVDEIAQRWQRYAPLCDWLDEHVGESASGDVMPRRR